jgi:hypothetical protein
MPCLTKDKAYPTLSRAAYPLSETCQHYACPTPVHVLGAATTHQLVPRGAGNDHQPIYSETKRGGEAET